MMDVMLINPTVNVKISLQSILFPFLLLLHVCRNDLKDFLLLQPQFLQILFIKFRQIWIQIRFIIEDDLSGLENVVLDVEFQ